MHLKRDAETPCLIHRQVRVRHSQLITFHRETDLSTINVESYCEGFGLEEPTTEPTIGAGVVKVRRRVACASTILLTTHRNCTIERGFDFEVNDDLNFINTTKVSNSYIFGNTVCGINSLCFESTPFVCAYMSACMGTHVQKPGACT